MTQPPEPVGAEAHYRALESLYAAAPINQLLATGGVLAFLQSAATIGFGIDFKSPASVITALPGATPSGVMQT